jgi:PAS domain S-box-containing protein
MSTIQFKEANCKNCYRCLRNCMMKAISFHNGQAEILEEECILCGKCLKACPQHAKTINNYVDTVKKFINKKEQVYVSLAPSFITSFQQDREWIYGALKRLGFTHVEETSVGALQVSRQYEKLMNQKKMKNIITTACPSVVLLVEKHYPELIPQLAPVVSPMIAHAKMMRKTYGNKIKVVFIGPCIAKIEEYKDFQNEGVVDAVITFEELWRWITAEGIDENTDLSDEINAMNESLARIYPIPGGILRTIDKKSKKNYHCFSVDGVDRCTEILESMKSGNIQNYFLEMNCCADGCVNGPYKRELPGGFLEARRKLLEYTKAGMKDDSGVTKIEGNISFGKTFANRRQHAEAPSEDVIQGILNSIGKFTEADELNCGACGYTSCREKAVAVYQEKAQLHMCLPYMRERAESMSNLIINTTPDAIFALDKKLYIQEANSSALEMFGLGTTSLEGKSIYDVLDYDENLDRTLKRKENVYNEKHFFGRYDITVEQSVVHVEKQNITVILIRDISQDETRRNEMFRLRKETVDIAQSVIDKQMRVAQEIASLLGETTAETKVILTKLQKTMLTEMSEE